MNINQINITWKLRKDFFGNIKDRVRKANHNQPAVWVQDSGTSIDGVIEVDNTVEPASIDKPVVESSKKPTTKHQERSRKAANKSPSPSGLDGLWSAAKASKAKKNLKESQVWVDDELYRKIELLNLKGGKPVPTKHIVNAILRMFMDEHKKEMKNIRKPV